MANEASKVEENDAKYGMGSLNIAETEREETPVDINNIIDAREEYVEKAIKWVDSELRESDGSHFQHEALFEARSAVIRCLFDDLSKVRKCTYCEG